MSKFYLGVYYAPHFSQRSFLEKNVYYIWQITVLKIMDIILPSHSTMFLMAVKNFSSSFSGLVSSYLRYVFPPCFYNVRFIITCQNWYQYKNGLYGPNWQLNQFCKKKKKLWVTYYKVSFLTHTFFSAKIWKCEALVIHGNKILFHFFFKPWFWILQENDCWYRMLCKLHESKLNLLCPNTLLLILFPHIKRNVSSQCL